MAAVPIQAYLREHPLFAGVRPRSPAFKKFCQHAEILNYKRGAVIYKPGERPQKIFIVREGEIHIEHPEASGQKRLLSIEGRGAVFGEVSFLTGELRSSFARAFLESWLIGFHSNAFLDLMTHEPSVGENIARILSRRLRSRLSPSTGLIPSLTVSFFYPGNEERGRELASVLSEFVSRSLSWGKVLLLSCGTRSVLSHENGRMLSEIIQDWPGTDLQKFFGSHSGEQNFDVIGADLLSSGDFEEIFPQILGRLRKYYSLIVVESCADQAPRVLKRLVRVSDSIIFCGRAGQSSQPLEQAIRFARNLNPEFSKKALFVTEGSHQSDIQSLSFPENEGQALLLSGYERYRAGNRSYMRKSMGRLARIVSGTTRGLVLGGGGARAFAQVGVMYALEKDDIDFDAVIGTSMGAIIGASYAMGRTASETHRLLKEILPDSRSVLDARLPFISFFRGNRLNRSILKGFGQTRFEELELPFYCNASDLNSGNIILLDRGYLAAALRASVSLPGIFPPVAMGNMKVVDGGVLNNLPGNILREKGYRYLLGVNVTPLTDPASGDTKLDLSRKAGLRGFFDYISRPPILKIIYRSITMEGRELIKTHMKDFDYVLHPELDEFDIFDFDRADEIIDKGYRLACQQLDQIRDVFSMRHETA